MLSYELPRGRGNSQFHLSEQFKESFPIGTVLTIEEFDAWAVNNRLMPISRSQDARTMARSHLRKQISSGGTCAYREEMGEEGFVLNVSKHSVSYKVTPAASAYQMATEKLPAKVTSIVETNREKIATLRSSSDFEDLPLKIQLMAELFDSDIDDYQDVITAGGKRLLNKFSTIQAAVSRLKVEGSDTITQFLAPPAE